jgi:hypothetical protein
MPRGGNRAGAGRKPGKKLDAFTALAIGIDCENEWQQRHTSAVLSIIDDDGCLKKLQDVWSQIEEGARNADQPVSDDYLRENPQKLEGLSEIDQDVYLEKWWRRHDDAVANARCAYHDSEECQNLIDENRQNIREQNGTPEDVWDSEQAEEELDYDSEIVKLNRGMRFTTKRLRCRKSVIEKIKGEYAAKGVLVSERMIESCWKQYRKNFPANESQG